MKRVSGERAKNQLFRVCIMKYQKKIVHCLILGRSIKQYNGNRFLVFSLGLSLVSDSNPSVSWIL